MPKNLAEMLKLLITCSLLFDIGNKHPQGVKKFAPDKILLYVHGATYRCAVS